MLYSYKMTLRFHLRYDRPDADERYPITLRITLLKQRAVVDCEMRASEKEWDQKTQSLRGNAQATKLANARLLELKAKHQAAYFDLLRQERPDLPATAANVKAQASGALPTAPPTLLELSQQYLLYVRRPAQDKEGNTVRSFITRARALDQWVRGELRKPNLLALEITQRHARHYEQHLLAAGKDPSTVRRYVAWLRQVLGYAVSEEQLGHNILLGYKSAQGAAKPAPTFLPAKEVELLWQAQFVQPHINRAVDAWLFCYETGLIWADYENFDPSHHLHKDESGQPWIRMVRQKMKKRKPEGFSVPVTPRATLLLERYRYHLPKFNNSNGNKYFKLISKELGLSIPLTWKIARSSFAQYWTDKGVDSETIAGMMGDTEAVVKKHYARIREARIGAKVLPMFNNLPGAEESAAWCSTTPIPEGTAYLFLG